MPKPAYVPLRTAVRHAGIPIGSPPRLFKQGLVIPEMQTTGTGPHTRYYIPLTRVNHVAALLKQAYTEGKQRLTAARAARIADARKTRWSGKNAETLSRTPNPDDPFDRGVTRAMAHYPSPTHMAPTDAAIVEALNLLVDLQITITNMNSKLDRLVKEWEGHETLADA